MLNYEFPPIGGGAANANLQLLKEFGKSKKLSLDLITSSINNKFEREKFSDNITIYKLDVNKKRIHYWTLKEIFKYTWKATKLAKKLIKQNKYDLVHAFFALPSGLIAMNTGLPYIVSVRGSDVPGFNPRLKPFYRTQQLMFKQVCSKAKKVIANSEGLKQLTNKSWKKNVEVIPNGINTDEFKPIKNKSKKITLITVARLIPRKGLNYLIKALQNINADLIIVGEGPEKDNLKQLARKYKVHDKVKFLGYVKHNKLPELYGKSDIFVLPSLFEGMSNTVLEAMACGLPIITTDTGGTNELIKDNGIIIEKKSSLEILNAANKLISDKKKLAKYGTTSRKIALTYSWSNVASEYLKTYKQIIK